jgi:ubiquinone/menaquinone biosynthesis C-methylase UbiE
MAQLPAIDYNQAAGSYAAHRRVHPGVFRELCERGRVRSKSKVLEVGCGTGNYVSALVGYTGCRAWGLDPFAEMLAHAGARPERVGWLLGRAEQMGFAADGLNLVFSVDVIHHVSDRTAFYREAARVLQPGGYVCTVTDSEEIIRRREVLSGYFPETVEVELARYPRLADLEKWMAEAGLAGLGTILVEEPFEISSAQPYRDKAFSSLHLISEEAWRVGLERLEQALARGPIRGSSRYACLWGRKEG